MNYVYVKGSCDLICKLSQGKKSRTTEYIFIVVNYKSISDILDSQIEGPI